jgi:hypothetical protein
MWINPGFSRAEGKKVAVGTCLLSLLAICEEEIKKAYQRLI